MRSVLLLSVLLLALVGCRPPGYGKGDDADDQPDAAVATPDGGGDGDGGVDAPSNATCHKEFRLEGHGGASSVYLTGDFVDWAPNPGAGAVPFTLGADGAWTGAHDFPAGTHQYKFIVSERDWIADPANPDGVDDGFGGRNSLYSCTP